MIVVVETDIPPNEDGIWTSAELDALARERVGIEESNGEISLHTIWLGGEYENPDVVGVAGTTVTWPCLGIASTARAADC